MQTPVKLSSGVIKYDSSANSWTQDLQFFKVEGIFFRRLLAAYFVRLSAARFTQQLSALETELAEIESKRHELDMLLSEHLSHKELVTEDLILENPQDLEATHIRLGRLITGLTHKFRHTKRALFALVEEAVKNDELFEL
jgi:hypothetical protein